MTVRELGRELTYEELIGWSAYFAIKNEEMERDSRSSPRTI